MKKVFLFLFFLILITVGITMKPYIDRWLEFSFCDKPITYKLGNIDTNFNVAREKIIENIRKGADIWNKKYATKLFTYDEEAKLTINLVFDDRQEAIRKIAEKRKVVESEKSTYFKAIEEFELERNNVQKELDDINTEIQHWNNKGGAPENVYNTLISKQSEIQKNINKINDETDKLNQQVEVLNSEIEDINKKVESFNSIITVKPEEGLYNGAKNTIDIYIYETDEGFQKTVAHELAHALGLNHIETKNALMNPTSSPDTSLLDEDIAELERFCRQQNRLDVVQNDLRLIKENVYIRLNSVLTYFL